MNLKRTSIIPLDDKALARIIFDAFIEKEFMIVMVILGDTDSIREALTKADNLATKSYFGMERWVLWIRNHDILEIPLKELLKNSDDDKASADYEDIKCFCFSPVIDHPAGFILKQGRLDYVNLQQSFFKAQSHDTALTHS